jgi:hypothetical protein
MEGYEFYLLHVECADGEHWVRVTITEPRKRAIKQAAEPGSNVWVEKVPSEKVPLHARLNAWRLINPPKPGKEARRTSGRKEEHDAT